MKKFAFILLFALCIVPEVLPQSIYDSLSVNNFREYNPFNDTININSFNPGLLDAAIFFATNKIRLKHKLPLFKYHAALEKMAIMHSKDMVEYDFFAHADTKNKKHKTPEDRAKAVGITNPHIAENIIDEFILNYNSGESVIPGGPGIFYREGKKEPVKAHTYLSLADELLDKWMHSKPHRANILSKDAIELGCGCAIYFRKDFNEMPALKATQDFQGFFPIILK